MRTVLDTEDIDQIAKRVAEIMMTLSSSNPKVDDRIFSVEELAEYLRVSPKWIYDHKHELPHFKLGGRLCFRKRDIDRVIDTLTLKEKAK